MFLVAFTGSGGREKKISCAVESKVAEVATSAQASPETGNEGNATARVEFSFSLLRFLLFGVAMPTKLAYLRAVMGSARIWKHASVESGNKINFTLVPHIQTRDFSETKREELSCTR